METRLAVESLEIGSSGADVRGACHAGIATADVVSYLCTLTANHDDNGEWRYGVGESFVIDHGVVREVDPTELFVPGTRLDEAVYTACKTHNAEGSASEARRGGRGRGTNRAPNCSCEDSLDFALAMQATSLAVVYWTGEEDHQCMDQTTIPYADFGRYLRPRGPMSRLPHPIQIQADTAAETDLARAAAPVAGEWSVVPLGTPAPLPVLGARFAEWPGLSQWQRVGPNQGVIVAEADDRDALWLAQQTPELTPGTPVPRGAGGEFAVVAASARIAVRAAPAPDARVLRYIPSGTLLTTMTGPLAEADSVVTTVPGLWTYVVGGTTGAGSHRQTLKRWTPLPVVS